MESIQITHWMLDGWHSPDCTFHITKKLRFGLTTTNSWSAALITGALSEQSKISTWILSRGAREDDLEGYNIFTGPVLEYYNHNWNWIQQKYGCTLLLVVVFHCLILRFCLLFWELLSLALPCYLSFFKNINSTWPAVAFNTISHICLCFLGNLQRTVVLFLSALHLDDG